MRRSADANDADGFDAFARALQSTFPAREDAPLSLLRLLSEGRPLTTATLAQAWDQPASARTARAWRRTAARVMRPAGSSTTKAVSRRNVASCQEVRLPGNVP